MRHRETRPTYSRAELALRPTPRMAAALADGYLSIITEKPALTGVKLVPGLMSDHEELRACRT